MSSSKNPISLFQWFLRRPLFIESIRQGLPESEETDKLLRKLQSHRENLDALIYALSSHTLAVDRRQHLREMLIRQQAALEESLAEMGIIEHYEPSPPLGYYQKLDLAARAHLAAILSVPEEPEFYEVLNIKAEEYLAQQQAFHALTEHLGFEEQQKLTMKSKKPALLLTLSGSLIQISEPTGAQGLRRYSYQNIYGNAHPPEGTLLLDRDIQVGHRLRSVQLTTSPVRLLRVAHRKLSASAQSQAFERVSRTLASLVSRSSSLMAVLGFHMGHDQTKGCRQANLEAAGRVYQQEYHEALVRYENLHQQFTGEFEESVRNQLEAELLTICLFLQTGARELGFDSKRLDEVEEFTTQGELCYNIAHERPVAITLTASGKRPDVVFADISVGRQLVTTNAPLAIIGQDGGLVEVTRPVVQLKRRCEAKSDEDPDNEHTKEDK